MAENITQIVPNTDSTDVAKLAIAYDITRETLPWITNTSGKLSAEEVAARIATIVTQTYVQLSKVV